MSNAEILMLGGSHNGKRIAVPSDQRAVEIAILNSMPPVVSRDRPSSLSPKERYIRVELPAGGAEHAIFIRSDEMTVTAEAAQAALDRWHVASEE